MEREYHVTQGGCGCGQFLPVFITGEAGYTTQQISPSGNKGGEEVFSIVESGS